ncbi:nucleoside phosphatase GDA1/CD39 [Phycomyces nitens]|nr:nucleoside phosphatase GDA1/CD39 [Phycomyces nitens]
MIDAGSSGSRVHIYRFNICREEPQLENEVFHMIEPGLSAYQDDPQEAARSLDVLMEIANENVPLEEKHCTPLAVKATAGLRSLGNDKSALILDAVRSRLKATQPFPLAGDNAVEIMDGKDEGVYAWITVNYLLGNLKPSRKGQSAAVFDLGGASTQIVFEPQLDSDSMTKGDHEYKLTYANQVYHLYQHSYLGFGLKEARKAVRVASIEASKEEAIRNRHIYDPCMAIGHVEQYPWTDPATDITHTIEIIGTGAGHEACTNAVKRAFRKDKPCKFEPCAFDGMYQPPIRETFKARDLYVFSFFYDLTQPLGMPSEFSVGELSELAGRVCHTEHQSFQHYPSAIEAITSSPEYCQDLTYIDNLLRFGYDVPKERLVRTAKKIRGAEIGWCLGASIAMIDQIKLCQL